MNLDKKFLKKKHRAIACTELELKEYLSYRAKGAKQRKANKLKKLQKKKHKPQKVDKLMLELFDRAFDLKKNVNDHSFLLSIQRWADENGCLSAKQYYRLAKLANRPDLAKRAFNKPRGYPSASLPVPDPKQPINHKPKVILRKARVVLGPQNPSLS